MYYESHMLPPRPQSAIEPISQEALAELAHSHAHSGRAHSKMELRDEVRQSRTQRPYSSCGLPGGGLGRVNSVDADGRVPLGDVKIQFNPWPNGSADMNF